MGWCGGDVWTIFEKPLIVHMQEEVTVPEVVDESQIATPLQSYQDPPAVHSNEGGTLVSSSNDSVSVTMEGSETASLPIEEPVTDTTPSPP